MGFHQTPSKIRKLEHTRVELKRGTKDSRRFQRRRVQQVQQGAPDSDRRQEGVCRRRIVSRRVPRRKRLTGPQTE